MDLIQTSIGRLCEYSRSGGFQMDAFTEITVSVPAIPLGHFGVEIPSALALPVSPVTPQSTLKDLVANAVGRLCEFSKSGRFQSDSFAEVSITPTAIPTGHYGVTVLSTIQLPVSPVTPQATTLDLVGASVNRLCEFLRSGQFAEDQFVDLGSAGFDYGFDGGLG